MNEIFARAWENPNARLTGLMNLRLIIQPTVATILAIRARLRDAHQNRGPFLWAVLWNPAHRRELLQQGWKDITSQADEQELSDRRDLYKLQYYLGIVLLASTSTPRSATSSVTCS
jgi:hypothetical protein